MNKRILRLCVMALMSALCYVGFTYMQIKIPTAGGFTSFHLGNTFCILASLLIGGIFGGVSGSIGMGIGDVLDPVYITVAPKTIILKFIMGFICGSVAHKMFNIEKLEGKELAKATFISTGIAMLGNVVLEPLFSYVYYMFVLGLEDKALKAIVGFNAITTLTNAILATVIASTIFIAIKPRLANNGILKKLLDK